MYKYIFKLDRRTKRITWISVAVMGVTVILLYVFSTGLYVPMWFLTLIVMFGILLLMSIPRSVSIDDEYLDIRCLVELTHIKLDDIIDVRRIEDGYMRRLFPLLGSYGFGGYFGYYLNLRTFNIVKMYATGRRNLIAITDVYEQTYIINCDTPDQFIERLQYKIDQSVAEDE